MDLRQNEAHQALPDDVDALKAAVGSLVDQVAYLTGQLTAAHAELYRLRPLPSAQLTRSDGVFPSARLTRSDGVFPSPSPNPFAASRHTYPANPFGAYPGVTPFGSPTPFVSYPARADPFGSPTSTETPNPFGRM